MAQSGFEFKDNDDCFMLIDALAYLKKKSLRIYQESKTTGVLKLAHRYDVLHGSTGQLNALYSGHHYSLLDASKKNAQAVRQEKKSLEILKRRKLHELEIFEQQRAMENRTSIHPHFSDTIEDDVPESEAEDALLLNPVKKEERFEDEESEASSPRFSVEDVINFIDRKRGVRSLPGLDYARSLKQSLVYCQDKITQSDIQQFDDRHIPFLFGIARLMLEFEYYPDPSARDEYAEKLLGDLKNIIRIYKNSPKTREGSKLRRFANYARIYAGKTLMTLNRFDEAYKTFRKVEEGYTKTYLIDIAQMILEHGYRPYEIGNRDPIDYAKKLLEDAKGSSADRAPRASSRPRQRRAPNPAGDKLESTTLAHPAYVRAALTNNRRIHLVDLARRAPPNQRRATERRATNQANIARSRQARRNSEALEEESGMEIEVSSHSRSRSRKRSAGSLNASTSNKGIARFPKRRKTDRVESAESTGDDNSSVDSSPYTTDDEESFAFVPTDDQEEFRRLILLGNATRNRNEAREIFQQALNVAEELNDDFLKAHALVSLGQISYESKGADIKYFKKALRLSENKITHIKAHLGLGHSREGNWIEHYNTALKLAQEIGNKELEAQAHIGIGNNLARKGNNTEALKHLKTSLKLAAVVGNVNSQIQAHLGLGNAHDGDEHFHIALELAMRIGDKNLEAQARIGIAIGLAANRNNEEALNYFNESFELAEEIGDKRLQAKAHIGIGNCCASNKENEKALIHFSVALKLAETSGDIPSQSQAHLGMGNARGGDEHFNIALKFAEQIDDKNLQTIILIGLGKALARSQRFEEAVQHYDKALKLAEERRDIKSQIQSHLGIGDARGGKEHFDSAFKLAK